MMPTRCGNAIYGADPFIWKWVHERVGDAVPELPHTRNNEALPVKTIGFITPRTGVLGAGIVYFDYRGDDITIGLAIEDKATVTREMIDHCCRYPFRTIGVGRVTMFTSASHQALRRVAERIGFVLEGTRRGTDTCMYGLLAGDAEKWMRDGFHVNHERAA